MAETAFESDEALKAAFLAETDDEQRWELLNTLHERGWAYRPFNQAEPFARRRDFPSETGEVAPLVEREAEAYRVARRRLRHLHTSLAGRREDWANNTAPCSSARAVAYQSAMQSVHSILDEVEAIAEGVRRG